MESHNTIKTHITHDTLMAIYNEVIANKPIEHHKTYENFHIFHRKSDTSGKEECDVYLIVPFDNSTIVAKIRVCEENGKKNVEFALTPKEYVKGKTEWYSSMRRRGGKRSKKTMRNNCKNKRTKKQRK